MKIRRAILSVSDKRGIVEFARGLAGRRVEILSTGGTARALTEAGIEVTAIADYTGAPEILGGRVKTLHPKIHGGLLGRSTPEHQAEMNEHGVATIDLVVVNLYPFERTVARPDVTRAEAIESIDIGGPTMLRAAAKNHERVAVVVDPDDYAAILAELADNDGGLRLATRFALARKAFAHTAAYDGAIAAYLSSLPLPESGDLRDTGGQPVDLDARRPWPDVLTVQWRRVLDLRYGENPHQSAAFYADASSPLLTAGPGFGLADATVLQGKPLSYNNILDLDAALGCCREFADPTVVVVKHTNPCGVASHDSVAEAFTRARATDPTSSFGGIVCVNREVDAALAALLVETFLECVVAPGYSAAARGVLGAKKNLRLVATGPWPASADDPGFAMRSVAGGLLVQSADPMIHAMTRPGGDPEGDRVGDPASHGKLVTRRAPTADERATLDFVWRVCKHVKSNAIVYGRGRQTLGVGAGQMSRVDSARIARDKAPASLAGSCAASDAFFPFRDGLDALAEAGATAVIQPGGSIRDEEVIAAADEHGMAMVFTGHRHFRH